jgi:hypothetical protein
VAANAGVSSLDAPLQRLQNIFVLSHIKTFESLVLIPAAKEKVFVKNLTRLPGTDLAAAIDLSPIFICGGLAGWQAGRQAGRQAGGPLASR